MTAPAGPCAAQRLLPEPRRRGAFRSHGTRTSRASSPTASAHERIRIDVQPLANVTDEAIGRPGAVGRDDPAVLHDGHERHLSLVFLPEELLNVELRICGERLAQITRNEARHFRRRRPGCDFHAGDQVHERAALQRQASRRETARSRSQSASRGSDTTLGIGELIPVAPHRQDQLRARPDRFRSSCGGASRACRRCGR